MPHPHSLLPDLVARAGFPLQTELALQSVEPVEVAKARPRSAQAVLLVGTFILFPNGDASPEKQSCDGDLPIELSIQLTFKARADETQTPKHQK